MRGSGGRRGIEAQPRCTHSCCSCMVDMNEYSDCYSCRSTSCYSVCMYLLVIVVGGFSQLYNGLNTEWLSSFVTLHVQCRGNSL